MHATIVLFVCFGLFLGCFTQDITEAGTQSSTEGTSTGTQEIDWDLTDSPKRTTVQDGRRGRYSQATRTTSDYTTLFPNRWGPRMLPVVEPPYGSRIQSINAREETRDAHDFYSIPRRPDALPVNFTTNVDQYPTPSDAVRHPLDASYLPYTPMFFYPRHIPNESPEGIQYPIPSDSANPPYPLVLQDLNERQNISASSPAPFYYGLPNARLDERIPYPFVNYPLLNFILRNRGDGRNLENIVPFSPYAVPPGLYPSPLPPVRPGDNGQPSYPQIDIFVRPPYVDREPGLEPLEEKEEIPRSDSIPSVDTALPISPVSPPQPVESIPPEPLPSTPLPLGPFPFGFLPPGLPPRVPFPLPQGVIPPPVLPARPIPSAPLPSEESFPRALPSEPSVGPSEPEVFRPAQEIIPPPQSNLPPLPPPAAQEVVETAAVPEVPPVPGVPPPPEGPFNTGKTPYEFGFDMNDGKGTDQHRQESADEAGVVTGSYGYRDINGVYRLVNYIADKNGFRAFVQSNEPGVANPGSADVVVMAERPPTKTVADSLKSTQVAVEVPDDLLVQPSEIK